MKKVLLVVGIAVGASLLARRVAAMCRQCNFAEMVERMPDDAPPKWMFRNISEIRANTERILELLSVEKPPATESRGRAGA